MNDKETHLKVICGDKEIVHRHAI